jgi:hypothetical protein
MKKAFLTLVLVTALTSVLWFTVSAADAAVIKAPVYSEFFTNVAAGERVSANIVVDGNFQKLNCVATDQPGTISCQFPVEYAGKQVSIELTKDKIMFIYTVDVPKN